MLCVATQALQAGESCIVRSLVNLCRKQVVGAARLARLCPAHIIFCLSELCQPVLCRLLFSAGWTVILDDL